MTDSNAAEQQQQFMAVPIQLMGIVVKILSALPYEQVSGVIPQLTSCQTLTGSPQQAPEPPTQEPPAPEPPKADEP